MTKHLLVLTLLAWASLIQAQSTAALINQVMTQAREGGYQRLDERALSDSTRTQEVLATLLPYYSDTVVAVRAKAYRVLRKVGLVTSTPAYRQLAVNQLLQGATDPNSGIAGIATASLTYFTRPDFDSSAQNRLRTLLQAKPHYFDRILLLVGFVNLNDQISTISGRLAVDTLLNRQSKWASHLALARLGVASEIGYVVDKVKNIPLNDDVVYELLPDLAYTRQPAAIDYLFEVVHSENVSCESADPESTKKILCGYRVLELLAPIIAEFPYQIDDSGDLVVSDYREALASVRTWHQKNPNYTIIENTY